jgi:hypothetical protein
MAMSAGRMTLFGCVPHNHGQDRTKHDICPLLSGPYEDRTGQDRTHLFRGVLSVRCPQGAPRPTRLTQEVTRVQGGIALASWMYNCTISILCVYARGAAVLQNSPAAETRRLTTSRLRSRASTHPHKEVPAQRAKRHHCPAHRWTGITAKKVFLVTSTIGNDVADAWAHAGICWRDCS